METAACSEIKIFSRTDRGACRPALAEQLDEDYLKDEGSQ
jgi:hypothetical protein